MIIYCHYYLSMINLKKMFQSGFFLFYIVSKVAISTPFEGTSRNVAGSTWEKKEILDRQTDV